MPLIPSEDVYNMEPTESLESLNKGYGEGWGVSFEVKFAQLQLFSHPSYTVHRKITVKKPHRPRKEPVRL